MLLPQPYGTACWGQLLFTVASLPRPMALDDLQGLQWCNTLKQGVPNIHWNNAVVSSAQYLPPVTAILSLLTVSSDSAKGSSADVRPENEAPSYLLAFVSVKMRYL